MKTAIKVTDQVKFDAACDSVDVEDLSCTDYYNGIDGNFMAQGHMTIAIDGVTDAFWSEGDHGPNDFEDEYGFVLVVADNENG